MSAGFQATAAQVQQMHQAISVTAFDNLQRLPGFSVPTRIVQGVHDAISQGLFAAVRHGGGAAFSLATGAERLGVDPFSAPAVEQLALRSALNMAVGESLMASGNALVVQMSLHAGGVALKPTRALLAKLRPRVAVFIHGLACDEQSWSLRCDAWSSSPWAGELPPGEPVGYGALLERELDMSAVYLRYNTALSIDNNAQQLARLLERVAKAAPQVMSWVPIGHSMGGLVALRAHKVALDEGLAWPDLVPMMICLGSPDHSSLQKVGPLGVSLANWRGELAPPARVPSTRSAGKGSRVSSKGSAKRAAPPAIRFVYASVGDESDAVMGPLIGKLFGDGLVLAGNAKERGRGQPSSADVERVEVAGLGHMGLLNHPRVYSVIRAWLGAAPVG